MRKIIIAALFILISSTCYGQENFKLNFPKEKLCVLGQLFEYKSFMVEHGRLFLTYKIVPEARCMKEGPIEWYSKEPIKAEIEKDIKTNKMQ